MIMKNVGMGVAAVFLILFGMAISNNTVSNIPPNALNMTYDQQAFLVEAMNNAYYAGLVDGYTLGASAIYEVSGSINYKMSMRHMDAIEKANKEDENYRKYVNEVFSDDLLRHRIVIEDDPRSFALGNINVRDHI